jgi:hypothetical protein
MWYKPIASGTDAGSWDSASLADFIQAWKSSKCASSFLIAANVLEIGCGVPSTPVKGISSMGIMLFPDSRCDGGRISCFSRLR